MTYPSNPSHMTSWNASKVPRSLLAHPPLQLLPDRVGWQLRDHCPRPPARHQRMYAAPWLRRSSSWVGARRPREPGTLMASTWDDGTFFFHWHEKKHIQINHMYRGTYARCHGSYGLWFMVTFVHFQGVIYTSVLGFVGDVFSKRAFQRCPSHPVVIKSHSLEGTFLQVKNLKPSSGTIDPFGSQIGPDATSNDTWLGQKLQKWFHLGMWGYL